ncbi:hypothetical protein [Acidipila sp. EB88]|uniref:hypothetical protein n=1 Tax=Acidipila sp. EB88 TaxID=2305226 RepID=UPI001F278737|nr:hypothetical protein [Acidipila sp. EB88]
MSVTVNRNDSRFESLKKSHNTRFPIEAGEAAGQIILCSSEEETTQALQAIVSAGLRPTVRSGGHCYEDFVTNNPGVPSLISRCSTPSRVILQTAATA